MAEKKEKPRKPLGPRSVVLFQVSPVHNLYFKFSALKKASFFPINFLLALTTPALHAHDLGRSRKILSWKEKNHGVVLTNNQGPPTFDYKNRSNLP